MAVADGAASKTALCGIACVIHVLAFAESCDVCPLGPRFIVSAVYAD